MFAFFWVLSFFMLFDNIVTPMITTNRKSEKIIEYSLLFTNINTKNCECIFCTIKRSRFCIFYVDGVCWTIATYFPSKQFLERQWHDRVTIVIHIFWDFHKIVQNVAVGSSWDGKWPKKTRLMIPIWICELLKLILKYCH